MITSWKCSCGNENSITLRYCPSCSREISSDFISQITGEEFKWAKATLAKENREKRLMRASTRHAVLSNTTSLGVIGTILLLAFVLYLWWCTSLGLDPKRIAIRNGDLLLERIIDIFYIFGRRSFILIRDKIMQIIEGIGRLLNGQESKANSLYSSYQLFAQKIGDLLSKVIK